MDTNVVTSEGPVVCSRREVEASFSGEVISLEEAVKLASKSKVTVLKMIKESKVPIVGKIISGKRGRPGHLYDRDIFLLAIHTASITNI